jgi:hypothetical protein
MTIRSPSSTRPDRMQPAQVKALCESIDGRFCPRTAVRTLGRDKADAYWGLEP